jgi:hypothetical protein
MFSFIKIVSSGIAIGLVYLAISAATSWRSLSSPPSPKASGHFALSNNGTESLAELPELPHDVVAKVEAFCGDCHAVPDPASFARHRWADDIKRGYEFYARSGRTDLDPPSPQQTLAYYLARSSPEPQFSRPEDAAKPLKTTFRVEKRIIGAEATLPEVSSLIWAPLQSGGKPMLIATDMKYGHVVALDPNDADSAPLTLARLGHPARIQPVAFTGDGSTEFLVSDLGSYMPAEETRGRVMLLRRPPGAPAFETIELASDFARVADARAADFDGDGKMDLVVAEFGWQRNGGIWLLRNVSPPAGSPRFKREKIDDRPGTIHVPIHDFDDDGRPDILALVSQEYEAVDLFHNRIDRSDAVALTRHSPFVRLGLWAGPDLTFGVSGLQLCDLNQNGKMDIVITNGDTWDNLQIVPTHGIQWLENRGGFDFKHHRIAALPGAYATAVFDADGDGDLDIIAVSWLPQNAEPQSVAHGQHGSIVCLEQTDAGVFVRHTLETGSPFYSSVASGDFNGDGHIDFAVASGPMVAENRQEKFYLSIWWNQPAGGVK